MKQMLVTIALSQEQRAQLVQAAPEYSVVWSPPGEVTEETVASSEVIFGTVPPDYLAKAGKLGLLQLGLWDAPNLILTPHASGGNVYPPIVAEMFRIFLHNLDVYRYGGEPISEVDRQAGYRKYREARQTER